MSEMVQGSAEWLQARCGKATASRVGDIIAKTKAGKPTAERERYLMACVVERLTGLSAPTFINSAMLWGSEQEPAAAAAYEFATDYDTVKIGFVDHPSIPMFGASPDRLVGDEGLVEFKCPMTHTHVATWLEGKIPDENLPQMLAQFACCPGRQWIDFVSYDPRVPDNLRLFVRRAHRADHVEAIAQLEDDVRIFLADVDARIAQLETLSQQVLA